MSHIPDDVLQDWAKDDQQPRRNLAFELLQARAQLLMRCEGCGESGKKCACARTLAAQNTEVVRELRECREALAAAKSELDRLNDDLRIGQKIPIGHGCWTSPDTVPDRLARVVWSLCVLLGKECSVEGAEQIESTVAALKNSAPDTCGPAIFDVARERGKQRDRWGAKHDERHSNGELLHAAMNLIASTLGIGWIDEWGLAAKHDDERDRCVIAAALVVAEIDRLDAERAKEVTS